MGLSRVETVATKPWKLSISAIFSRANARPQSTNCLRFCKDSPLP
jgi:hypothetical protein